MVTSGLVLSPVMTDLGIIPTREGWYWAVLVYPARQPSGESWASTEWEIVHVIDNNGAPGSGEEFMVAVGGIGPWQPLDAFVWGPEVECAPPKRNVWDIRKELGVDE